MKYLLSKMEENPYLPVLWIDKDGVILKISKAVTAFLGYHSNEIAGKNICDIDINADISDVHEYFEIVRMVKVNKVESVLRHKDGSLLNVEVVSNYYIIDDIEVTVNYLLDITYKKKQEAMLKEKNAELERLTAELGKKVEDRTKDLLLKISELEKSEKKAKLNEELFINAFKTSQDSINLNSIEDGRYIMVNDGFTAIMGYTQDEVIGKSSLDLDIWKNPEDRLELVRGLKENGYYRNLAADFVRKDGEVIHGLMSASIQEFNGEKVILNVSKDITKMKELENSLKELNEQLKVRVEEELAIRRIQEEIIFEQKKLSDLGMVINAIAHQWRQPLNNIGLQAQSIADMFRNGELTEEIMDSFEESQMKIVKKMSSIIDDFRNFFKPDERETEFEAVEEILALLRLINIQLNSKGIKLYVSCKCHRKNTQHVFIDDFPNCEFNETIVKGFKGEFKQVITNIIYNSIDAIEEKFGQDMQSEKFIHMNIFKGDKDIVIQIEDNGAGFKEGTLSKVFNPYFSTKDEGKGTGLGLYQALVIIHTHMNGKINAFNTERGAAVEIAIPSI
jgi:PAS domain S-box-containing protein